MHDAVESGRAIRVLSVVDAYTRECLALEVDTSFASRRVTRVLERIVAERGVPQAIRCDNGPELTSRHFLAWCMDRKIELVHIQPGRPMQNGRVESFNGRMREECLNVSWFGNLFEARGKIAAWRREYNEERPHSSLGYRTPEEFACEMSGEKGCGEGATWESKNNFSTPLGNPAGMLSRQRFKPVAYHRVFELRAKLQSDAWIRAFAENLKRENLRWADLVQGNLIEGLVQTYGALEAFGRVTVLVATRMSRAASLIHLSCFIIHCCLFARSI